MVGSTPKYSWVAEAKTSRWVVCDMKKTLITCMAVLVLAAFAATTAHAEATADNWSVKLTFSTSNTSDLLPITVGEGASSREVMKPPPMPGQSVTNNPDDAIVNAYIRSSSKKAAESVEAADTTLPGRVWPVDVNVEEGSAAVTVTADLTDMYDGYDLSIIIPTTGERIPITQSNVPVSLFSSDADGGVATVYVMAGSSNTFVVSDGEKVLGGVDIPGREAGKLGGVTVEIKGSGQSVTTDSNGMFEFSTLSPGTYTIRADGPNLLATEGTLTISADGSVAVAMKDATPGDITDDGSIDVMDFLPFKKCFGQMAEGACLDTDLNLDGGVDVQDFLLIKKGFGTDEPAE